MTDEPHDNTKDDAPGPTAPDHVVASEPAAIEAAVAPEAAEPPMSHAGTRVLTGDAQAAARGKLHDTIEHNTAARDRALGVISGDNPSA